MTLLERLQPWRVAVLVFIAAAALCRPWGNYPLNDDWQYARTAKTFAATGRIVVDTPVAPALVGQTLLAAPILRLFGFSHTALRLLTLGLAALGLWCVDRLLRHAGSRAGVRLAALVVLAFNPLFFYLGATFMNEIYGHVPALLAAVLWFAGRRRARPDGPAVGAGAALLAGALMGAAFWTRQSGVVWFAALAVSALLPIVLEKEWHRLRRSLPPLFAGAALCGLMVALYFPWTRATGNVRPQFTVPLAALATFDGRAWVTQTIVFVAYLSVFLAPLLLLVRVRRPWGRQAVWAGCLLLASWLGSLFLAAPPGGDLSGLATLRPSFPYLGNVLYDSGLGPVLLISWAGLSDRPRLPGLFAAVHLVSILAVGLWGLLIPRLGAFDRRGRPQAFEVFLFGAFGAVLSLALMIQAFRMEFIDRYHLPGVLGGVLALGAFLGFDAASETPAVRLRGRWPAAVLGLALSVFTVAALHDYFRWNDARWALVRGYLAGGGSPMRLYGGYEVSGWLNYDAYSRPERPSDGGPAYHCNVPVPDCVDDTWCIAMTRPPLEYRAVRSIQPRYWLTPGRWPVTLYRRD